MKAPNVLNRIHVQRLLLAVALSGVSIATHAAYGIDRARGQAVWDASVGGKSTTIGSSRGMEVYTPVGQATSTAAGGARVGGTGSVPVNGKDVPVQRSGEISKGDLAAAAGAALGCASSGPAVAIACAGAAIALPLVFDWAAQAGVRINDKKELETQELIKEPGAPNTKYGFPSVPGFHQQYGWNSSKATACNQLYAYYKDVFPSAAYASVVGSACTFYTATGGGITEFSIGEQSACPDGAPPENGVCETSGRLEWKPNNLTRAISKFETSEGKPNPEVANELARNGAKLPLSGTTVSGPASITGPSKSTTTSNSTTNSTTTNTSTTNNYTYQGNTITNISNVTNSTSTNTTRNPDGTTTVTNGPSQTETDTPGDDATPKEAPPTQCDKYPDTLGCAELDVPEGEIPRENKDVSWSPEDPFGGGACPVDQTVNLGTIGKNVKVTNWVQMCEWSLPLRFIVLALATFGAFLIVMPGETRV